jgi:hypothetical protein
MGRDYKKAGCKMKPSKKKAFRFEEGVVPYPRADDNLFMASGPEEKILRAKRAMRYYMNEDRNQGLNTCRASIPSGARAG